jgi:solute carrier family 8 (sodium/calcium exchanger)
LCHINCEFFLIFHSGQYELKVQRYSGARGKVIIPFWTEDGTAKGGKDYEPQQGELVFENNESE